MSTASSLYIPLSITSCVSLFFKGIPFFNLMVLPNTLRMKNLLCLFSNSPPPCGKPNTQILPAFRRASIYFQRKIPNRYVLHRYEFTPSTREDGFRFRILYTDYSSLATVRRCGYLLRILQQMHLWDCQWLASWESLCVSHKNYLCDVICNAVCCQGFSAQTADRPSEDHTIHETIIISRGNATKAYAIIFVLSVCMFPSPCLFLYHKIIHRGCHIDFPVLNEHDCHLRISSTGWNFGHTSCNILHCCRGEAHHAWVPWIRSVRFGITWTRIELIGNVAGVLMGRPQSLHDTHYSNNHILSFFR